MPIRTYPNAFRPLSTRSSHYYAASTETKLKNEKRDSRRLKPTIYTPPRSQLADVWIFPCFLRSLQKSDPTKMGLTFCDL